MYKKTKGYAKKRMNKGGTVKMARMMKKGGATGGKKSLAAARASLPAGYKIVKK